MLSFTDPWLASPWSKGIAAGIISGLLVAWASHLFLSRIVSESGRRRNLQKIAAANREIMQTVRLAVAESQIPRREVITALTNATARQHGLEPSDLYKTPEIAEDLMKDVMESSLLSAVRKSDICAQLSYLLLTLPPPAAGSPGVPEAPAARPSIREASGVLGQDHRSETQRVSALTGILAGVLSGVFAGRGLLGVYLGGVPHWLRIGLEALAGIVAALVALLIVASVFHRSGWSASRRDEIEDRAVLGGSTRNPFLGG